MSVEEKIKYYARKHQIDEQAFYNLAWCESRLDPLADNGHDRGILQINRKFHPNITDEMAFDVDWALDWGAKEIAEGRNSQWTCGNCYSTAKLRIRNLPRMADINPNTAFPVINGLIIFNFNGLKHIAVVEEVRDDGILVFEGNYRPNIIERRLVKWNDKNIVGFWRHPD